MARLKWQYPAVFAAKAGYRHLYQDHEDNGFEVRLAPRPHRPPVARQDLFPIDRSWFLLLSS
jgi:hypothetical protein